MLVTGKLLVVGPHHLRKDHRSLKRPPEGRCEGGISFNYFTLRDPCFPWLAHWPLIWTLTLGLVNICSRRPTRTFSRAVKV